MLAGIFSMFLDSVMEITNAPSKMHIGAGGVLYYCSILLRTIIKHSTSLSVCVSAMSYWLWHCRQVYKQCSSREVFDGNLNTAVSSRKKNLSQRSTSVLFSCILTFRRKDGLHWLQSRELVFSVFFFAAQWHTLHAGVNLDRQTKRRLQHPQLRARIKRS